MLKRFYELRKEVKIAMVQLEQHFDISDEELVRIRELCDALAPIEMAVEYLCKEDADLLLAEKVTEFTARKLRDLETSISLALVELFQARVRERQNPDLIYLLKYLKNPEFFDLNKDQFGIKIRKTKITALATSMLQRHFHQGSTEENEVVVEVSHDLAKNQAETLSEEFASFIEERHQTTKVQDEVESCIVKKEMGLFEATKKDQTICKNCSMPFLQSNQRLWSQKGHPPQWDCLQQNLEANYVMKLSMF